MGARGAHRPNASLSSCTGRGRGAAAAAAAPRTEYAELASGFPSPKKKSGCFSVLDVFKISGFLEVFWTFLVVLFDDERPTRRRGEVREPPQLSLSIVVQGTIISGGL